jgi:hypothetical protein
MLEALLATRAAVDSPALAAVRARHLAAAKDHVARIDDDLDRAEEEERLVELAEAHAAPPRPAAVRPTALAQQALAYLDKTRAAKKRADSLGPLAEAAWASRRISVDAPELVTMDAWMAASGARQLQTWAVTSPCWPMPRCCSRALRSSGSRCSHQITSTSNMCRWLCLRWRASLMCAMRAMC